MSTDILIVDDHPLVREGLITLISKQGDFRLCGGDGVLQVLEEEAAFSDIPVILLEGGAAAGFPRGALPANIVGRLEKPFAVESLLELGFAAAEHRGACGDAR